MKDMKTFMNRIALLATVAAGITYLGACTKSGDSASKAGAPVKINAVASEGFALSPFATYPSSATNLESMKYMIRDITLCESLTPNGSGFSDTENCANIYTSSLPEEMYSIMPEDITQDILDDVANGTYADLQIDLMDAASRAKINQSASIPAGTYNYAIITWFPVISFKASISVGGGTTMYTKPVESINTANTYFETTGDFTTGPSQTAAVTTGNGGSYFRFPKAFVITEADVEAKTEYVVDLVFNPEAAVTASPVNAGNNDLSASYNFRDANNNRFWVPMLSLAPVPRLATDTNKRESYELTTANGKWRVELYYNASDSTKTVMGADMVYLYDGNGAKLGSVSNTGNVYSFGGWTGLKDFVRDTSTSSACTSANTKIVAYTGNTTGTETAVTACEYIGTATVQ